MVKTRGERGASDDMPVTGRLPGEGTEPSPGEVSLRDQEPVQTFLLDLSDALRAETSGAAIQARALRMLFERLRLDRCCVGLYRLAEEVGEFPYQVHDMRLPPLPDQMRLSDFPKGLRALFDRTLVIGNMGEIDGLTETENASLANLGICAVINATLRKGENNPRWALVAVSSSPRVWTSDEVSLVEDVAERTWAAVERAQIVERLKVAHDTFRDLIDRSPFGTYIVDADFRFIQISEGGQKAFGILRTLIGRDFSEVVHAVWTDPFASHIIARFRHTLETGEPFNAKTSELRADAGAIETYDWKIERIVLPDGRYGVVCHFYDLTDLQRQKEHINLLMGEVNHRSKNLLSLIEAIAQQTAKTQPEHFLRIFGQRLRALSASQDLLVKGEWKAVDLGDLVRSQLAFFRDEHDGRIAIEGPSVKITASASQSLGMALHELATNAAKFGALSNESGQVSISWRLRSDANGQARFAMSWIESGGPAIVKPERSGFGSAMIDAILRTSIGCEAEVSFAPSGLIWRIDSPAAGLIQGNIAAVAQLKGTPEKHGPVAASGRRILIVEDEPLVALVLGLTLSEAGYVVIGPANSVSQALAALSQSGCDAALLDVNLGTETSEPIARELMKRRTPFAFLTGYTREQLPEIMQTAPLLNKPVSEKTLIAAIERMLALGVR